MAKYITVLNSNLDKPYWSAIQWSDSLQSLRSNPYYNAGTNMNIEKVIDDQRVETKSVTERTTGAIGSATIIKLSANSTNLLKLASGKATKSFLKTIKL